MLQAFKKKWDIQDNWQLLFPLIGLLGLAYSSFKLALFLTKTYHITATVILAVILFTAILKFILFLFQKLENKWAVTHRWEIIRIFMVFAITGSSSMFVGKPIIRAIGITKENLNPILYWVLFIIIGMIFYQILLVSFGWLFGQFKFFWEFEKKMLKRFGLGRFLN
ncbi:hypothetical protein ES692_09685 [Psychroserpens burtonensis]|uniref:DUF6787 domain-containing protein n=1 Tax=Psychroserpens burtonensis TaxID=49278 RepID=A0A5C7B5W8_9FLAO|nr:DUF6787 family protein [Psychroserpens burtonensis]TXE17247.1 hypothetical protein ES692_09685 [Psychroserpens burtonensis]